VVNHFNEMPCSRRSAIEKPLFRCALHLLPTRRRWDVPLPRRQTLEDWFQTLHGTFIAANHQTVPTLYTPNTAASSGIKVMDPLFSKRVATTHIILVERISSINDRIP